jgi:hypothetical protein
MKIIKSEFWYSLLILLIGIIYKPICFYFFKGFWGVFLLFFLFMASLILMIPLINLCCQKIYSSNFWSLLPLMILFLSAFIFFQLDDDTIENLDFKFRLKERTKIVETLRRNGKTGKIKLDDYFIPIADFNEIIIEKCPGDSKVEVKFPIDRGFVLEYFSDWIYTDCYDIHDPFFKSGEVIKMSDKWYKVVH